MPNQVSSPTVTPNETATNGTLNGTAANETATNATINESMNQTVGQLPPPLDALGQGLFPGQTGFAVQVVVTALILFAVFAVRYYEHKWVRSMASDSVKRIAASGAVAVVTALGILLLVDVWGLAPALVNAFKDLEVNERAGRILISAILLGTAYILTNFIGRVIQVVAGSGDAISRHQREILFRLTQVFLYATVIFVIISLFTDNIGSLLVGAGFFGIIVGMAARQSLGAVLAGFVLMFSRPFEIGDWIVVGDKEGTVTDITIFNTRLQTFDGEYVILPNDEVSSDAIVNRTRKGRLRIEVEVGVDYDADPQHAADVALGAVEARDEVLDVPSPQVVMKEFASSSVLLGVRFWIDNPSARRMWRARTAAVAAIKEAFDEEGISIPFPQRSLSSRDDAGDVSLTDPERNGEATTDGGDE
ncbi:Small-conductance mechanosensitive channel [Halogranum rubrum]|uniref:Small-conductance mechanosensitive channel n=1 Tax=Halogranum rubrum TaxID=553466 RepID=A0A1I4CW35_9EURY|nr:mechanosensitive ion channel family protein [Halogranum rubrum]SFK85508.1 Small-conductance mechanosensitive channel [Halogranum rubrum]